MLPRDQEAFELYQATKHEPRAVAASLLDEFFNRLSVTEYEEIQSCVTEIMEAKPIFISDLPPHLSGAL